MKLCVCALGNLGCEHTGCGLAPLNSSCEFPNNRAGTEAASCRKPCQIISCPCRAALCILSGLDVAQRLSRHVYGAEGSEDAGSFRRAARGTNRSPHTDHQQALIAASVFRKRLKLSVSRLRFRPFRLRQGRVTRRVFAEPVSACRSWSLKKDYSSDASASSPLRVWVSISM